MQNTLYSCCMGCACQHHVVNSARFTLSLRRLQLNTKTVASRNNICPFPSSNPVAVFFVRLSHLHFIVYITLLVILNCMILVHLLIFLQSFSSLFFLVGAATPSGPGPPHSRGFKITHNDGPQSVELLWTSDQLVAEAST